ATLVGSLKGGGTISIEGARLAALDPRAFEAAIGAADRGVAINAAKIGEVVEPVLAAGDLVVERADGAVTVAAGQARVSNVIAHGRGADLALSGTIDLTSRAVDARLMLSGPAEGGAPGTARPDLLIALQGPAASPRRSVDVSALVSWLMLRSLDRETRRMEAVEAGRHDPAAPAPARGRGSADRIRPGPLGCVRPYRPRADGCHPGAAERKPAGISRKTRAGHQLARAGSEPAASGRDPSGTRNRLNSGRAAEGGFTRAVAAAYARAHGLAAA